MVRCPWPLHGPPSPGASPWARVGDGTPKVYNMIQCVYVSVCIHKYIYISLYICIYVYVYICICICIYIYISALWRMTNSWYAHVPMPRSKHKPQWLAEHANPRSANAVAFITALDERANARTCEHS